MGFLWVFSDRKENIYSATLSNMCLGVEGHSKLNCNDNSMVEASLICPWQICRAQEVITWDTSCPLGKKCPIYLIDLNSHLLPIFSLNPFTRLSQVQVGIINEHEGGKYYRPCQPNHPLLDMSVFSQVVLFLFKMPLQRIWVTKAFSCPVHHILNIRHERSI